MPDGLTTYPYGYEFLEDSGIHKNKKRYIVIDFDDIADKNLKE